MEPNDEVISIVRSKENTGDLSDSLPRGCKPEFWVRAANRVQCN